MLSERSHRGAKNALKPVFLHGDIPYLLCKTGVWSLWSRAPVLNVLLLPVRAGWPLSQVAAMTRSGPQSHFLPYKAGWWPSARGDNEGHGACPVSPRVPVYLEPWSWIREISLAPFSAIWSAVAAAAPKSCRNPPPVWGPWHWWLCVIRGDLPQACRGSHQLCHPLEGQPGPRPPPGSRAV